MKFSIIVPVYNRETFLDKCLTSILNQTYNNYEVIVINDGSTDKSQEIINRYTLKDNRISSYERVNSGIADTRNFGVSKVTGDYILFLDSDDYWEKDLLLNINESINTEIDIVKFKCQLVDNTGIIKVYNNKVFSGLNKLESLKLMISDELFDSFCVYAFNTKFYKENNFLCKKGLLHEDFGLIPLIILKAKTMISIDYIGYNYFKHDNSITNNKNIIHETKKANDAITHYRSLVKDINEAEVSKEEKDTLLIYIVDSICRRYLLVPNELKKKYLNIINKEKTYRNLPSNNFKRLIKKVALMINVKLYLWVTNLSRK